MKALSSPEKSKNGSAARLEKDRTHNGELFLGYKALHELRILVRIASGVSQPASKDDGKQSF
jgi:hypothetical protein